MTNIFFHETAIIESDQVGQGTHVYAYSHVMSGSNIGDECRIGDHCFVESGAVIGDYVTIKNGNMVWEGVTLEDGVFVGPAANFTNDLYPRSGRMPEIADGNGAGRRPWLVRTLIRRGAAIGASSVIVAGVEVGEFAMIGAGAVVTKNVKPHSLVIGAPARHYQWVCSCGLPLKFDNAKATCEFCNRMYEESSSDADGSTSIRRV